MKLKNLIESFQSRRSEELRQLSTEEKREMLEIISNYNEMGKVFERQGDLSHVAENLGRISEAAKSIVLSENGEQEWMEQKTVSENMRSLENCSKEFKKAAEDARLLEQRMIALYEDCGHVLQRYFEIREPIKEIQSIEDL